jgi:hypothetical protein
MARNPAMAPVIAPLWAKYLDIPDSDRLSQALTAVSPEPVKAIFDPDGHGQESVGALKAQLEQVGQKLQEAAQIAQEAQQDADQANQELEAAKADQASKASDAEAKQDEVAIKSYEAITKRLDTLMKAVGPQAAPMIALSALPPDMPADARALLVETIHQASMQPDPDTEGGMMQEAPEVPEVPEEDPGPSAEMQALEAMAQGQQQLMQAMGQLIKLVQAKRVRTPERGPDGSITRVVDAIDLGDMQPEGPMQ